MAHPSTTSRAVSPYNFAGALTDNKATAQEKLGTPRVEYDPTTESWQKYIYVKNSCGTALADGTPCYYNSTDFTSVTVTMTSAYNKIAGVGVAALTSSYYGWIQVYGYHDAVLCSAAGTIAAGDFIIGAGTAGLVARSAAGATMTYQPLGVAVAADSTTSVEAFLTINPL